MSLPAKSTVKTEDETEAATTLHAGPDVDADADAEHEHEEEDDEGDAEAAADADDIKEDADADTGDGDEAAALLAAGLLCSTGGHGVKKDEKKGFELFLKAANLPNPSSLAVFFVGNCYAKGDGVETDEKKGVEWYHRAAEAGNEYAQYSLGVCYLNGVGVAVDRFEAIQWLMKAADQGNAMAREALINIFRSGDYGDDLKDKPGESDRKAAEEGDADAQFRLSEWYLADTTEAEADPDSDRDSEGVKWLRRAADQNHAEAMMQLANLYHEGSHGVEQDEKRAIEILLKADSLKLLKPFALNLLGSAFALGLGVAQDEKVALSYYRRAVEAGDLDAMWNLAQFLFDGSGCEVDNVEAVKWLKKEVENEKPHAAQPHAAIRLGDLYLRGSHGVEKDQKKAVECYRRASAAGLAKAQWKLSQCYLDGLVSGGSAAADAQGVEWLRRAAAQSHPEAMFQLGGFYIEGVHTVEHDVKKAIQLFQRAAAMKHPPAMTAMGTAYEHELGVEKDEKKAVELYRQAAEAGYADGYWRLSQCYLNGVGVTVDKVEGVKWLKKAAEANHPHAVSKMAEFSSYGLHGVAKDKNQAQEFARRAAQIATLYVSSPQLAKAGTGARASALASAADRGTPLSRDNDPYFQTQMAVLERLLCGDAFGILQESDDAKQDDSDNKK